MNKTIKKQIPYIIFLLLTLSSVSALTVQDLINSYNFDYNNGTINVTSQLDYMIDKESDGANDTLIINLTSNATSGTYTA